MTKAAEEVLAIALELGDADREEMAAELLASLAGEPQGAIEAAWTAEIERRMERIDAGTAKLVPWEETQSRIEQVVLKR